ncbi:MAG TPA: 3-deoxy-7-phosphoheptulonate synthase, partial [Candidatus Hydrogenedens sp.]|nr:3-deoxy-7-phosphoheptulonate synthase [Candidatus Hydrogenedens sp.]
MKEQISKAIENINVVSFTPLISPREMKELYPLTDSLSEHVAHSREVIQNILNGKDLRFLIIVGPCSIHSEEVALEYAQRLRELQEQVNDVLFMIMRTYFEKPRTTLGWKGLIYDPD